MDYLINANGRRDGSVIGSRIGKGKCKEADNGQMRKR